MTPAQRRLIETVKAHGEFAEYWPVMEDWLKDKGPTKSLALHNINRTVDVLVRGGYILIDDDGLIQLTEKANG
jgi:hypothetical protein